MLIRIGDLLDETMEAMERRLAMPPPIPPVFYQSRRAGTAPAGLPRLNTNARLRLLEAENAHLRAENAHLREQLPGNRLLQVGDPAGVEIILD